jgi:hypothetical protein
MNLNRGITDIKIDMSGLSKGMYLIRLTNSMYEFKVIKIVKM